jgi:hypothetical protein
MNQYPQLYSSYQQELQAEQWRAAVGRSYVTPAVICLVLYFVLWLPGLIANFVYLVSARQTQHITGHAPEGKGCLTALIWVFFWMPLIVAVVGIGVYALRH